MLKIDNPLMDNVGVSFPHMKIAFIHLKTWSIGVTQWSKSSSFDLVSDTRSALFHHLLVLDIHHLFYVIFGELSRHHWKRWQIAEMYIVSEIWFFPSACRMELKRSWRSTLLLWRPTIPLDISSHKRTREASYKLLMI